jgi:outer membrane protein assembly factor BamB
LGSYELGLSVNNNALYANINGVCGTGSGVSEAALDPTTGQVLWNVSLDDAGGACPTASITALSGKAVYARAFDGLHALDAGTGTQTWSVNPGGSYGTAAIIANGVIYVWGNDTLFALKAKTGKQLWSTTAPSHSLEIQPVVADGTLYVVGANCGSICAFDLP